MNSLRKILVVDNGRREEFDPLSQELAELGVSSVTASVEAANDVLGVIDRPSAIFLKVPSARYTAEYQNFLTLADVLKRRDDIVGIPVIMWDGVSIASGGISAILQSEVGPLALSFADA